MGKNKSDKKQASNANAASEPQQSTDQRNMPKGANQRGGQNPK